MCSLHILLAPIIFGTFASNIILVEQKVSGHCTQTQVYILCTPFYCTVIDAMHTGMSCWKVVKYDKHIVSGSCDDDIMLVLTRLKTHWSCIYIFQQSSFSYRRWLRESRERERGWGMGDCLSSDNHQHSPYARLQEGTCKSLCLTCTVYLQIPFMFSRENMHDTSM